MNSRPPHRRRNYFIKKKFQIDFSIKFLVIIVLEAVFAIGLFLYLSKGTLTTGYYGSELKVASTYSYFLPMLLLSNLIIVGVTGLIGIAVLIFLSHRMAGPLYRFENVLGNITKGDLTQRFQLRETDQFTELSNSLNSLIAAMNSNIGSLQSQITEISKQVDDMKIAAAANPSADKGMERALQELCESLQELRERVHYFKTS